MKRTPRRPRRRARRPARRPDPRRGAWPAIRLALRIVALVLATIPLAGFDSVDALRFLHGRWQGAAATLTINADTMQANSDPERPFDWKPFRVRNVTPPWLVFLIGEDVYIVTMVPDPDEISVFVGGRPVTLRRIGKARGHWNGSERAPFPAEAKEPAGQ